MSIGRIPSPWPHMPRESRDTLFLLCVVAWTLLPHALNLPAWCLAFVVAVLLWRTRLALFSLPLPSRWWLLVTLGVALVLTQWSHGTLVGREPGVTLLVSLMALKTLELRARRDAFVVFFLGFFLVLSHFFYSQTLLTALMMVAAVWGLLTALVLAHMPAGRPRLVDAGGQAARAALWGTPLMVLLFLLFPRIGPMWGVSQEMAAKTGLSGSLTLGAMAQIAEDDSIAMRIRLLDGGTLPPPESLYFRGPVLNRYDGREWRESPGAFGLPPGPAAAVSVDGAALRYEMTLEPSRLTLLPLLEIAAGAPDLEAQPDLRPVQRADAVWLSTRPLLDRVRLRAAAHTRFRLDADQSALDLILDTQLPPGYNPRTVAWARALRGRPEHRDADPATLAGAVLRHIRAGGYGYTLAPGSYGDADPRAAVDEFWFDRKMGFCEHFAATFTIVMRAMGVPTRIVTGYQGVDPLPVDGYYVVRQSHAHAWAEYWVAGAGWQRVDPTAAVAPERIVRSRPLRPAPGLMAGALQAVSPDLLARLRGWTESLDNRWNQWVLNYSRGQQLDLLRELGMRSPDWQDLVILLGEGLAALALGGATWAWWDQRRQDPWTLQWQQVRRELQARGLHRMPLHATPRMAARLVRARWGDGGVPVAQSLLELDRLRFSREAQPRPKSAWMREFSRRVRHLARMPV